MLGLLSWSAAEGASNEASLRAAFVFKFIKFLEWPSQTTNSSLRLCALGAIGDSKEALRPLNGQAISTYIVEGKPVVKQTIELVFLEDSAAVLQKLDSCQILYRPVHATPIAVPYPLPKGVFLVADDPQPSDANVGIAMMLSIDGHIEFSISMAAANQAGVSVSSQLLKLARNSRGGQ